MTTAICSIIEIDNLIRAGAPVAIGVSGGKDSQACALATLRYLDQLGHVGPHVLVHADLGSGEWEESLPVCQRLAEHLGVELIVVRRKAGGLMERWESRWASSVQRYEDLSTVTLVPCWSTPGMRFCTSELKTHPITAELKRRFKGQTIINVTGVRRAESSARAKATIAGQDAGGQIWTWRPILDWSVDEVFAEIDQQGIAPHPAYREYGMSRVSCRWCIMSNIADMTAASAQQEAHELYRRMVKLECDSTFAFQGSRWLGDVAPHLLPVDQQAMFAEAKVKAAARVRLESAITPSMLYVKGWPTRMLSDVEADILSVVRRGISAMFGFQSACLDRDSVHARYAELIELNRQKDASRIKEGA